MSLVDKLLETAFPEACWEVDLHRMRVPEALETVRMAILAAQRAGGGQIRIVCGKGKNSPNGVGVLREAVGGWLYANGLGDNFTRQVDYDGRDGAIAVKVAGHSAS